MLGKGGVSSDADKTGNDKKDIGNLFADDVGKSDAKEENIAKALASISEWSRYIASNS